MSYFKHIYDQLYAEETPDIPMALEPGARMMNTRQNALQRMSFISTKGLQNGPGENNCFLNSAVQVLWHLDVFRRSFRILSGHACMGNSCIFCALKVIFTQFQYSDQTVLPPDMLRKALHETFLDQNKFQLGIMDDAAECFENILQRIHYHIAHEESEDSCQVPHCISHQKFAMNVVEQIVCPCGAKSKPLPFNQLVLYVSASALVFQAKAMMEQAGQYVDASEKFGQLVGQALMSGDYRDCPNNCGRKSLIRKSLMNKPDVVCLGLVWDSDRPDANYLMDVAETIGVNLSLNDLYTSVADSYQSRITFQLVGVVCYYGKHYSSFVRHTKSNKWIYFDDATVKEVGHSWQDVVDKCCKGRYQPLLLLYANPEGTVVNTHTAPQFTTLVEGVNFPIRNHSRSSSRDSTLSPHSPPNGYWHHKEDSGSSTDRVDGPPPQRLRSVTPTPGNWEKTAEPVDVNPRRAITPGPEWGRYEEKEKPRPLVVKPKPKPKSKTDHQRQGSFLIAVSGLEATEISLNDSDNGSKQSYNSIEPAPQERARPPYQRVRSNSLGENMYYNIHRGDGSDSGSISGSSQYSGRFSDVTESSSSDYKSVSRQNSIKSPSPLATRKQKIDKQGRPVTLRDLKAGKSPSPARKIGASIFGKAELHRKDSFKKGKSKVHGDVIRYVTPSPETNPEIQFPRAPEKASSSDNLLAGQNPPSLIISGGVSRTKSLEGNLNTYEQSNGPTSIGTVKSAVLQKRPGSARTYDDCYMGTSHRNIEDGFSSLPRHHRKNVMKEKNATNNNPSGNMCQNEGQRSPDNSNYINRNAVAMILKRQGMQKQPVNKPYNLAPPSYNNVPQNIRETLKVEIPDNTSLDSQRCDSGYRSGESGDRNSASSASSMSVDSPVITKSLSPSQLYPGAIRPKSNWENSNNKPATSSSSKKLDNNLHNDVPNLSKVSQNMNVELSEMEKMGFQSQCEHLCERAEHMLDQSVAKEKTGDLAQALNFCTQATLCLKQAMDIPYQDYQSYVHAQMKHNSCVMRSRKLHREFMTRQDSQGQTISGDSSSLSSMSTDTDSIKERDSSTQSSPAIQQDTRGSKPTIPVKPQISISKTPSKSKQNDSSDKSDLTNSDNSMENNRTFDIYATLPKKGSRRAAEFAKANGPMYQDYLTRQQSLNDGKTAKSEEPKQPAPCQKLKKQPPKPPERRNSKLSSAEEIMKITGVSDSGGSTNGSTESVKSNKTEEQKREEVRCRLTGGEQNTIDSEQRYHSDTRQHNREQSPSYHSQSNPTRVELHRQTSPQPNWLERQPSPLSGRLEREPSPLSGRLEREPSPQSSRVPQQPNPSRLQQQQVNSNRLHPQHQSMVQPQPSNPPTSQPQSHPHQNRSQQVNSSRSQPPPYEAHRSANPPSYQNQHVRQTSNNPPPPYRVHVQNHGPPPPKYGQSGRQSESHYHDPRKLLHSVSAEPIRNNQAQYSGQPQQPAPPMVPSVSDSHMKYSHYGDPVALGIQKLKDFKPQTSVSLSRTVQSQQTTRDYSQSNGYHDRSSQQPNKSSGFCPICGQTETWVPSSNMCKVCDLRQGLDGYTSKKTIITNGYGPHEGAATSLAPSNNLQPSKRPVPKLSKPSGSSNPSLLQPSAAFISSPHLMDQSPGKDSTDEGINMSSTTDSDQTHSDNRSVKEIALKFEHTLPRSKLAQSGPNPGPPSRKATTSTKPVKPSTVKKEKRKPRKSVTFSENISSLLAENEALKQQSESKSAVKNVPKSALKFQDPSGNTENAPVKPTGYDSDYDEDTSDSCASNDEQHRCNLCQKRKIDPTDIYCRDCSYYMARFKPKCSVDSGLVDPSSYVKIV